MRSRASPTDLFTYHCLQPCRKKDREASALQEPVIEAPIEEIVVPTTTGFATPQRSEARNSQITPTPSTSQQVIADSSEACPPSTSASAPNSLLPAVPEEPQLVLGPNDVDKLQRVLATLENLLNYYGVDYDRLGDVETVPLCQLIDAAVQRSDAVENIVFTSNGWIVPAQILSAEEHRMVCETERYPRGDRGVKDERPACDGCPLFLQAGMPGEIFAKRATKARGYCKTCFVQFSVRLNFCEKCEVSTHYQNLVCQTNRSHVMAAHALQTVINKKRLEAGLAALAEVHFRCLPQLPPDRRKLRYRGMKKDYDEDIEPNAGADYYKVYALDVEEDE